MTRNPGVLASLIQPEVSNRDQGIPGGSDKTSEWSRLDLDAHNPEDADGHTETNMLPHILSPVCMNQTVSEHSILSRFPQESLTRDLSDSKRVGCKQTRTRMISWSSTSNREDSWCGVGRSFHFESQGLILHIWGCTLDLMSEERIRRDSEASSFYEVVRENGRPRGNIRARPRETRGRA